MIDVRRQRLNALETQEADLIFDDILVNWTEEEFAAHLLELERRELVRQAEIEQARKDAAEEARREAEAEAERKKQAELEQERQDMLAREREEALRPDKEKLLDVVKRLKHFPLPEVSAEAAPTASRIAGMILGTAEEIERIVGELVPA